MHSWAERGFFGGHALLDFVNTVDDEGKTRARNAIPDWRTAVAWGLAAGLIDDVEAKTLTRHESHVAARDELQALYAFRECAWRAFSDIADGRAPDPAKLSELGDTIRWALGRASLRQDGPSLRWSVSERDFGAALLRARLALALFDLLAGEQMERLRECGRCTGLFLDHGRGKGRRWCRMEVCGNRAKIERYRART